MRRCRWIAVDLNATGFGLFFVSPSLERARLVPCFDSDYPGVAVASKFMSGANGEDMGGYQAIRFRPEKTGDFPAGTSEGGPVNGIYEAGSDHRKDGEAVGW